MASPYVYTVYITVARNVYNVNIKCYTLFMTETYHHGNLRSELIAGGIRMLNRDGIAAFSLRRLSQELGVSHGAAYRHFPSKEALLGEIFAEVSRGFRQALADSVRGEGDGRSPLTRLGIGYVRFFLDHPEYVPLFTLLHTDNPLLPPLFTPEAESEVKRDGWQAFDLFRSIAQTIRQDEPYRHLSENEILLGFWAKVHGLALLMVAHPHMIPKEGFEESLVRLMETPF